MCHDLIARVLCNQADTCNLLISFPWPFLCWQLLNDWTLDGNPKPIWQSGRLCVRSYTRKHQNTRTHLSDLAWKPGSAPRLCVWWVYSDGYHMSAPHVWPERGMEVVVEGENKACGRDYSQFWHELLSTPICVSGLGSLAKHNISSILSQWQGNVIGQRVAFFPSLSPSNVSFCLDTQRLPEPSGGVRKEKTKEPEVTVVEVEKQEEKSQPAL